MVHLAATIFVVCFFIAVFFKILEVIGNEISTWTLAGMWEFIKVIVGFLAAYLVVLVTLVPLFSLFTDYHATMSLVPIIAFFIVVIGLPFLLWLFTH